MAIEIIKERMVVVWNDDGSFKGASLDERFVYEDKSTRNAQRPLNEQESDDLIGTVEADLITQLEAANASIESLTAERDEALGQVTPLSEQVASLTAEIKMFRNPPFDPRVLHPYAFLQRFTIDERLAVVTAAKTDSMVGLIVSELQTVSRVRLDVESTQNGVGYLVQSGIIAQERISEILSDATVEEQ